MSAVSAAFFIPLPTTEPWVDTFFNFCHFPVFVFFGALLARSVSLQSMRLRIGFTFMLVALLGLAIEWIQPYVGRRGSLDDLLIDLCGGIAGVCLHELYRGQPRQGRWLLVACLFLATLLGAAIPLWNLWQELQR